jgi:hypothetical protein
LQNSPSVGEDQGRREAGIENNRVGPGNAQASPARSLTTLLGSLSSLNEEHLDHLERVIKAELRERPVIQLAKIRIRYKTNQNMPFNLPSWVLSAKNRPGLLRLIARLRKTIP